jgi:hypothetical protein
MYVLELPLPCVPTQRSFIVLLAHPASAYTLSSGLSSRVPPLLPLGLPTPRFSRPHLLSRARWLSRRQLGPLLRPVPSQLMPVLHSSVASTHPICDSLLTHRANANSSSSPEKSDDDPTSSALRPRSSMTMISEIRASLTYPHACARHRPRSRSRWKKPGRLVPRTR